MADKTEQIGKAEFKVKADEIDIDKAWEEARKLMSKVGITTASKPDVKKIRETMAKHKKAMTFVAAWDGKWLSIDARIGTVAIEALVSQDMSEGGDPKKWRAALELLGKNTKLVSDADIKAFDQKHPDPEEVDRLKARIDGLKNRIKIIDSQIKPLQDKLKLRLEELERLLAAVKLLGG